MHVSLYVTDMFLYAYLTGLVSTELQADDMPTDFSFLVRYRWDHVLAFTLLDHL
jgi:hypothetical protein